MQIGLYHTLVLPVITYASEIWDFDVIRDIALLLVKGLKHLLYVHKKTSNDVVYGKLGVCLIQVSIKCKMTNLWIRLPSNKKKKKSKSSRLMYKCLFQLDE